MRQALLVLPLLAALASWAVVLPAGRSAAGAADKLEAGDAAGAGLPLEQPGPLGATSSVLYNLGQRWHAQGDMARALGAWRAAWELEPSAGDIAHNLTVARRSFPDVPSPAPAATVWSGLLPAGALGLVSLVAWMAAAWVTERWRRDEVGWPVATGVALLAAGTSGLWADVVWTARGSTCAVVVAEAPMRDVPDVQDSIRRTLPVGTELRVDGWRGGFAHVEDGLGRQGWVVETTVYLAVEPGWWGR